MKEANYVINTTQYASATSLTLTTDITGTTLLNFVLSGLDETRAKVNKVVVRPNGSGKMIYHRNLATSLSTNSALSVSADAYSLGNLEIPVTVESEPIGISTKSYIFEFQRNDLLIDTWEVTINITEPDLDNYSDLNLIKTSFFGGKDVPNNLALVFGGNSPNSVGMSLIDNVTAGSPFDPNASLTQTSGFSATIGFMDELAILNAAKGHTLGDIIAQKTGNAEADASVKFRTAVGVGTAWMPGNTTAYDPATANSNFVHTSGSITWACDDTRDREIAVPLVDVGGASVDLTPMMRTDAGKLLVSRNVWFKVEMFDLSSCETAMFGTSVLTAFVNY